MTRTPHLVSRKTDTPPALTPGMSSTAGLPDDLLVDVVRRLQLFSAIGVGLWSYGFVFDRVFAPRIFGSSMSHPAASIVMLSSVVASTLMFLYVRYVPHDLHTKLSAGLAYLLLNAAGVAALNTWAMKPTDLSPHLFLSWNTVVVLVFAMIATAPPRQLLAATLLAASMDPLGVWLAHLRGVPVPSVAQTLLLFLPTYVCAAVAILPSLVLHRIGARLRRAQELGSYRLVEMLGQGGMGEVWRAEHRLLARHAAVKLVRPDVLGASSVSDTANILRRFEREARATAALRSPHTIQVFDFGTTHEGNFYYVMELLAGRDLESLVRDFGPLPPERVIFLMRQVCHSLAEAHARGFVHRDIKPANIYVCRMGLEYDFVKVLDFGLVKVHNRATIQQTLLSGDHRTSGTPAYMAPEVILGDADVDRRADVYAVGCVAYYLLTGHLVFEEDSSMKMLMRHVSEQPLPPSERSEMKIPPELDALVLSCLEKDPNKRPQNAEQLFRLALSCRTCEGWCQDTAREWWFKHMPEMCGPLTLVTDGAAESSTTTPLVHA